VVIDESHEAALIEALRKLREAKSLIDMIIRDVGDEDGKRAAPLIDALTGIAVRVSSARKQGEKLIRRRPGFKLDDDPYRPPQPKWGGGPPPFQIDPRIFDHPAEPLEPPPPPEPLERP
jgi:hypothetical protein